MRITKTERFEMRFSPQEKKRAERAADKRGSSLADFVRIAVAKEAEAILALGSYAK